MRVLVDSAAITIPEIGHIADVLGTEVLAVDGSLLHAIGEHDIVIRSREDLMALLSRAPASIGELRVTPVAATHRGKRLPLARIDVAILYELTVAAGNLVSRATLLERCWTTPPRPRTLDVSVFRLRGKLEPKTGLRIVSERELGYRLVPQTRERRVLVVEDDLDLHNTYRLCLAPVDVSVDFAESVSACIAMVAERTYDAYFVDLELPGGSGTDAIAAIRHRCPHAPIMIVSGHADHSAVNLSGRLGVFYAVKPVLSQVLQSFVARSLL